MKYVVVNLSFPDSDEVIGILRCMESDAGYKEDINSNYKPNTPMIVVWPINGDLIL